MASLDSDFILLRDKVKEAYKNVKTDSLVKNNKNIVDVLNRFGEQNKAKRELGSFYGFNDVHNNQAEKREKKKKLEKMDSTKVSEFLALLGLDENKLIQENTERERLYTLYKFVTDNLPVLNQALDITASSVLTPELINTDVFAIDDLVDSQSLELVRRIIKNFKLSTKVEEWIRESLLLGDSFVEIIDTETVKVELESQLLQESEEYPSYVEKLEEGNVFNDSIYTNASELLENCRVVNKPNSVELDAFMFLQESTKAQREAQEQEDKLNQIFLKTHEPENIIVIQVGDFVLGYLCIETENVDSIRNVVNPNKTLFTGNTIEYKHKNPNVKDERNKDSCEIITDRLYDILLQQLDKEKSNVSKFLKRNKDYYKIIYNVVVNKKKASIRYISPEKMVHWKHKGKVYGESIFASMLLLIKHYLALMTHMTLFNLTRGVDKRKITVEVSSLDMDAGNSLNNVIKSFKQKEQALINQINNIDSYSTELTAYDDIFLPSVNGEVPIEVDSIPGQQNDLDTDYLEELKSNILNGIQVPKSLLNEVENSYRTSLAQENIMFAMQILSKQALYEPILNDLIYKIINIISSEEVSRDFEVKFNPPISLLNESLSNNISNASSVVDFIAEAYSSDDSGGMGMGGGSTVDKKDLIRMFLKGIDWDAIDKLVLKKQDLKNKEKIEGKNEEDDMMGGFGDMGGGDMSGMDAGGEAEEDFGGEE